MATEADPIVSTWYQHLDKGQTFIVVAVDEDEGLIEIQHFDGDVEEIDFDNWYLMVLEQIESPENQAGALDVPELEDLGSSITDTIPDDWNAPMEELRTADLAEVTEGIPEPEGEWGEEILQEEQWEEK